VRPAAGITNAVSLFARRWIRRRAPPLTASASSAGPPRPKATPINPYAQNGRSRSESCFANELQGLTCLGERCTDAGLVQSRSDI
jgi:hypothetical protein